MKPAVFGYSAPESIEGTLDLLAEHGPEAKILAGGQSLVPMLNFRLARPAHLIDINGVDSLAGISANGTLTIGSMTRLTALGESDEVAASHPIIPMAVSQIGHRAIRNRGTIGGSLAHNDPAAELPAVLMALDAEVTARSADGERTLGMQDLIEDRLFETTLDDTELLTEISDPGRRGVKRIRLGRVRPPPWRLRPRRGGSRDFDGRIHHHGRGPGGIRWYARHPAARRRSRSGGRRGGRCGVRGGRHRGLVRLPNHIRCPRFERVPESPRQGVDRPGPDRGSRQCRRRKWLKL